MRSDLQNIEICTIFRIFSITKQNILFRWGEECHDFQVSSQVVQCEFCFTCDDGYGGLAGGRHWANLGGNGGAGLGGKVEHFLKVE